MTMERVTPVIPIICQNPQHQDVSFKESSVHCEQDGEKVRKTKKTSGLTKITASSARLLEMKRKLVSRTPLKQTYLMDRYHHACRRRTVDYRETCGFIYLLSRHTLLPPFYFGRVSGREASAYLLARLQAVSSSMAVVFFSWPQSSSLPKCVLSYISTSLFFYQNFLTLLIFLISPPSVLRTSTPTRLPPFSSLLISSFPLSGIFLWRRAHKCKIYRDRLVEELGAVEVGDGGLSGGLRGVFDECIAL